MCESNVKRSKSTLKIYEGEVIAAQYYNNIEMYRFE
nr:MAG TPA: hypothetical protein [Bacteriophage sp.]